MKHASTQTLETERLVLRRFREDDAQAMFNNWTGDAEVTKYLTWPTHPNPAVTELVLRDCIARYEKPDFYQWAIALRGTPGPIGTISVVRIDEEVAFMQIGYCIGREHWGQGIMTEAFSAVIPFLFEQTGANRLEARHDPRNPASGRAMQKCGLMYGGTLRGADRNNQGICDAAYYGILREEWENRQKS